MPLNMAPKTRNLFDVAFPDIAQAKLLGDPASSTPAAAVEARGGIASSVAGAAVETVAGAAIATVAPAPDLFGALVEQKASHRLNPWEKQT